jgi:hypothetical protein
VCSKVLSNIIGLIRYGQYHEGSKKPLDDPVPNSDFLILHCPGIGSSMSGIRTDRIRKYMSIILPMPNL